MGFIFWIIGLFLTVKAALEIWNTSGDNAKKLLLVVLLLLTSWLGLVFYYFFAKNKIAEWVR